MALAQGIDALSTSDAGWTKSEEGMAMLIRMDITKLTQAAAFLLKKHNGFMTRIRLLKLLYIADRRLIRERRIGR